MALRHLIRYAPEIYFLISAIIASIVCFKCPVTALYFSSSLISDLTISLA